MDFHYLATSSWKSWIYHHFFLLSVYPRKGNNKFDKILWKPYFKFASEGLCSQKKNTVLQDWIHCSLFFTLWMSKWNSLGLSQPCSGQSVRVWLTACGTINCPAAQQDCQGGGARAEDEEESRAVANAKQKEQAQHWLSGNSPNVALLINLTPSARPGLLFQTFRCVKITLS